MGVTKSTRHHVVDAVLERPVADHVVDDAVRGHDDPVAGLLDALDVRPDRVVGGQRPVTGAGVDDAPRPPEVGRARHQRVVATREHRRRHLGAVATRRRVRDRDLLAPSSAEYSAPALTGPYRKHYLTVSGDEPSPSAPFIALGDPTRLEVFELVAAQPRAVGDLAALLPVSRPAVSQHLKVLKAAGLVVDHAAGTRRIYRVDPAGVAALRDHLDQFWNQALAGFKSVVEAGEHATP